MTGEALTATLAFILVAVLTKLVGCAVPARLLGMSTRDSLVVGFVMAPRGEVAMIVALLALNKGVIEQPAYVALVIMSLVTTLIVPLVLRNWLYRETASSLPCAATFDSSRYLFAGPLLFIRAPGQFSCNVIVTPGI